MKESAERIVELGFSRSPRKVLDEVDAVSAEMVRQGWRLNETLIEESLGNIHLFFEREITMSLSPAGDKEELP
ncbi:MAG: hypothetical protein MUF22_03815 [Chitinispirillaceae bacterium]|jgi:hypothetical protein|nr:hypothetical protein [Chitinispirillaceae bacterium]